MRVLTVLLMIALAGCAEHPDPTTIAIADAQQTGGICTNQTAPLFDATGNLVQNWNCEDRAMRDIAALVYNDQE